MTVEMQKLCNKRDELLAKGNSLYAENKFDELAIVNKQIAEIDEQITAVKTFEESKKSSIENLKTVENKKFETLSEQLKAIKNAAYAEKRGGAIDERLIKNELSGGLNTGNDADGGYAIQSDFIGAILDKAYEKSPVLGKVTTRAITSDSNRANWVMLNDTQDAAQSGVVVSGGVQVYWAEEGATLLKSKPSYVNEELKLAKIAGICYTTEEMLQDVSFTAQEVEDGFVNAVDGLLREGIYNGLGTRSGYAPQPYGILNSNALVTVAPASSKLTAQDFLNMKARMTKKNWANAVWVLHPDLEASLPLLNDGNTPSNLVFMPAGGLSGSQYDTILGRPVIYDEFLSRAGTKGDVLLADFSEYMLIKKGQERKDWSMHVAFLTDEQVFRIILRVNGKPKRNGTYTVRNSSVSRSPFVTLGARGTALTAPTVTITSNKANWTAVTNATKYVYSIDGGVEVETTANTNANITVPSGSTIRVKAVATGYIDSPYGSATNA